jgi:hypothetical protein
LPVANPFPTSEGKYENKYLLKKCIRQKEKVFDGESSSITY